MSVTICLSTDYGRANNSKERSSVCFGCFLDVHSRILEQTHFDFLE
jgi:hypothetical protein